MPRIIGLLDYEFQVYVPEETYGGWNKFYPSFEEAHSFLMNSIFHDVGVDDVQIFAVCPFRPSKEIDADNMEDFLRFDQGSTKNLCGYCYLYYLEENGKCLNLFCESNLEFEWFVTDSGEGLFLYHVPCDKEPCRIELNKSVEDPSVTFRCPKCDSHSRFINHTQEWETV